MKKLTALFIMTLFFAISQSVASADVGAIGGNVLGNSQNMQVGTNVGPGSNLNFNPSAANGSVGQVNWNNFNTGTQFTHGQTIINRQLGVNTAEIMGKLNQIDPEQFTKNAVIIQSVTNGAVSQTDFNSFNTQTNPATQFKGIEQTVIQRQLGGPDIAAQAKMQNIDMSKFNIQNQMTNMNAINIIK